MYVQLVQKYSRTRWFIEIKMDLFDLQTPLRSYVITWKKDL